MLERFGKSYEDIMSLKTAFFEENDQLLARALRYSARYSSQPLRRACKICLSELPEKPVFSKHGASYAVCRTCGQLNGRHEDTDEYCRDIYTASGAVDYARNYTSADRAAYRLRRDRIYVPKAEFLFDVLAHEGQIPAQLSYADMGAGAGYFVDALVAKGARKAVGFEVGKPQVDLGNAMSGETRIQLVDLPDTPRLCREYACDVMTFIGVFEHLQDPRAVLAAIRENKAVKYIYFCVPMYAPTTFIEMSFPKVFPRQLAIGHTHLFTDSSIQYLEKEFGLERVGAWWFGTDMMDFFRSIQITLGQSESTAQMVEDWRTLFAGLIDSTQLAIDRERKSCQVHAVFKVCR